MRVPFLRTILVVGLLLMTAGVAAAQSPDAQSPDAQLRGAIDKELVDGDLNGAIQDFERILGAADADRNVKATALLHLGDCYRKLGDEQARSGYERLIAEFSDQTGVVAEAQSRLAAIGGGAPADGEIRARQLTSHENTIYNQAPSPDGTFLYVYNGDGSDAGAMDLTTGDIRWFGWPAEQGPGGTTGVVPSPDGRMLAYNWIRYTENGRVSEIRIGDSEGHNPRTISGVFGRVAGWTSDQGGLFLLPPLDVNPPRNPSLRIVDLASGDVRQILEEPGIATRYVSSMNGRWVAYALTDPDGTDVYVVPSSGDEPVLVSGGVATEYPLASTVNGNGLLMWSDRGGSPAVWGVAIEDGKPVGEPKLVYPGAPGSSSLGMTRSGTLLLQDAAGQRTLFEVRIDEATGEAQPPRRVDSGRASRYPPTFLPDGERTVEAFAGKLIVRDLDTGEERSVESPCGRIGAIYGVHPGGELIFAGCSQFDAGGYYLINVETGAARMLISYTDRPLRASNPVLSADGSRIYFFERPAGLGGPREFKSLDVASLDERDEWSSGEGLLYCFSPDGRQMIYLRSWDGGDPDPLLELVDIGEGPVSTIPPPEENRTWRGHHPAWSADGRWIFFTVWEDGVNKVKRMPAGGGPAQTLHEQSSGDLLGISVHPSGNLVYVNFGTQDVQVWALDNIGNVSLE